MNRSRRLSTPNRRPDPPFAESPPPAFGLATASHAARRGCLESLERALAGIIHETVDHDGGRAYKVGDVFSETFPTRERASKAAYRAAAEQRVGGRDETITYETERGEWKTERSDGGDRPRTYVKS